MRAKGRTESESEGAGVHVKSEQVSEQCGLVYMADEHVVGRQEYMTILC